MAMLSFHSKIQKFFQGELLKNQVAQNNFWNSPCLQISFLHFIIIITHLIIILSIIDGVLFEFFNRAFAGLVDLILVCIKFCGK